MDDTQNKSSIGGIIGTIIIIALIVLGGLYFWGKRIEESKMKQDLVSDNTSNSEAAAITSLNDSDDLVSIEGELKATNFDDLDQEINPELQ